MLSIYIDDGMHMLPSDWVTDISASFDVEYEPEWFSDTFVQEIISVVDKSEVILMDGYRSTNIYNEYLGNISPRDLSNGAKSLILLWKTDYKLNGDRMGNNCIPLLLRISEQKDITISLGHIPKLPYKFEALVLNNNTQIHSIKDFLTCRNELEIGKGG